MGYQKENRGKAIMEMIADISKLSLWKLSMLPRKIIDKIKTTKPNINN